MARKVGFGRSDDTASNTVSEKNAIAVEDRKLGVKLAKRLVVLGLIETAGVAILIRGILSDDPVPVMIGIAWMVVVTLVTLRVVLTFAGVRKQAQMRRNAQWPDDKEQGL